MDLLLQSLGLALLAILEFGDFDLGKASSLSGNFEVGLQGVSHGLRGDGQRSVQGNPGLLVGRHYQFICIDRSELPMGIQLSVLGRWSQARAVIGDENYVRDLL